MWITIAWKARDNSLRSNGWKHHVVVWTSEGTAKDVFEAARYARCQHHDGYQIKTWPATESDPLGKARAAFAVAQQ